MSAQLHFHFLFGDCMHAHRRSHAPHEVQHRQDHADVHRDHQVAEHGEQEGDQQDRHVRPRGAAEHAGEVLHLAHVVGDHEEDRRQRAERDVRGQRGEHQHDQGQGRRMDDPRQRAVAAVADVGRGAGDGAGGGEAAEQRRGDVGDALADQFLVGVVAGAGHAVGDHRREQRLDGAEHGDGEGRADQFQHARQGHLRQAQARQSEWNSAEGAADGGHAVEVEQRLDDGHRDHRHQRPGHLAQVGNARREQHQGEGQQRQHGGHHMQLRQRLQQVPELLVEMLAADRRQAEEVLPLADPDDHPDAGGEADDHRRRDELDDRPQARHAEQQEDDPGHDGGDLQPVDAVLRGHPGEDDDEGAGRPGDLHSAAAEQGDQRAGDDRRVDALLRLDPGTDGDGEGHRQRQRHHPDDHPGNQVARPVRAAQQTGFPCFL
ncbi:hypothetical protein D9M71_285140 [compost metagenome]